MLKKIFNRKKKEIKINKQISELINAHGFKSRLKGGKVIPEFKDKVELDTRIYLKEEEYGFQTRFDIEVKFENGQKLYEAFGDVGTDLNDCINRNIENFSKSSLHVFLDAFNDSCKYIDKEKWKIGKEQFDVFIGNYNLKSFGNKKIEIPNNLFATIEGIITQYKLDENYYFVRFYYGHSENESPTIEFMINNVTLDNEENRFKDLEWMKSDDFYSIRDFIILKRII